MRTDELPEVRLSTLALYKVGNSGDVPSVILEGIDWATVTFACQSWAAGLESTPLPYGGYRRWLCCPSCGGRRVALFIKQRKLACRKCLDLSYPSQLETERSRLTRRIDRLRGKLGWPLGPLNPEGRKPRGMHWRTYQRLRGEHDALMKRLLGGLNQWLDEAEKVFGLTNAQSSIEQK